MNEFPISDQPFLENPSKLNIFWMMLILRGCCRDWFLSGGCNFCMVVVVVQRRWQPKSVTLFRNKGKINKDEKQLHD